MANNAKLQPHFSPRRLLVVALSLALAACANTGGIQSQAQMRDPASLGLTGQASDPGQAVAQWWRGYGDSQLDSLVEQATRDNANLKLVQTRLARANAVFDVVGAANKPQLRATLDAERDLFSATTIYPPPSGGSIFQTATAQLEGSWELDLFGKNRAALNAALGAQHAAEADSRAATTLLQTNVVRAYVQLARLNDQKTVLERLLAQREEALKLVHDRVNAGLDTTLELRQSQGGLPDARQQIEAMNEQMALTRNAIAALVGQPSLAASIQPAHLSDLRLQPTDNAIGANLLARRADIVAARWRVEASGHEVDSAKAQFYPDLNLRAFAGFSSFGFSRLLHSDSEQWGVGPAVSLPLFEGGMLRANLRAKSADLDAAVQTYNATVIEAMHDAADQIATGDSVTRQQTEQAQAQRAAESAYDIARQRYAAGLGNYLNVLTAETGVLAQRRLAVDLAAKALDSQVALIRAIGGGYAIQSASAAQK